MGKVNRSTKLCAEIAHLEGKNSEARIGDIKEIVGILSDLINKNYDHVQTLIDLGKSRAKRKKRVLSTAK